MLNSVIPVLLGLVRLGEVVGVEPRVEAHLRDVLHPELLEDGPLGLGRDLVGHVVPHDVEDLNKQEVYAGL